MYAQPASPTHGGTAHIHTQGEIAWRLGYSSSQHLSNQFRQVTGMTPTQFKSQHRHERRRLDEV